MSFPSLKDQQPPLLQRAHLSLLVNEILCIHSFSVAHKLVFNTCRKLLTPVLYRWTFWAVFCVSICFSVSHIISAALSFKL